MQVSVQSDLEKRDHADAIVLPFWKGEKGVEAACELGKLKSKTRPPIKAKDFTAKEGEVVWIYGDEPEETRIALLGLGDKESVTIERLRRSYGLCAKACLSKRVAVLSLAFPEIEMLSQETAVKAILEGITLVNYSFDALKHDTLKKENSTLIEKIILIGCEKHVGLEQAEHVEKISKGLYLARDLVNGNADDITPKYLGEVARRLGKEYPSIKVDVHDRAWIEKQGMGLFLAVAKGSSHDPFFIVMKYTGNPNSRDHTVIVGKGITFDTGGLLLKPKGGIETQKSDMSGAAVAFGIMKAVAELELPLNLSVVVATCENAIGSKAYKPGDVYKAYSGKTVEITDTDAEGRLTLADALNWASVQLKPSRMIDFATLTGSMVVALGTELFGLMSNSDSLARELLHSGERTFERAWQFPLYDEYREQLKSDLADMKNSAGREGGAILAGIFLQEFVQNTPWAHFDIAGVSYMKDARRYLPKHATGVGVRLIIDYLEHLIKKGV